MNTPDTSTDAGALQRPAPPQTPWCLFLDIDGTLLDIAPTPDAVISIDSTWERVVISDPVPSAARRFARVKVTLAP
jgi:hypothetical protein